MKYLFLIWYGIWRKRGRTLLILFQILVAFMLFGVLQGVKSGVDAAIKSIGADVYVVTRDTGGAPLPLAQFSRIQSVPGVKNVTRESFLIGTYQAPNQRVAAIATDVAVWAGDKHEESADFSISNGGLEAMASTRNAALLGKNLAEKYGWKVGDRIPLQSPMAKQDGSSDWQFEVVGIFDDPLPIGFSDVMVIDYDYFNEARAAMKDTVARYIVTMTEAQQGLAVSQQIDQLFVNSPDETRTEALSDQAQAQFQQIGDLNFVVRAIVGAVMVALLFSTATMMMQSIRERTSELAVLKTIGFSDRKIFGLIQAEVAALCLFAAGLGLLAASQAVPALHRLIDVELQIPSFVLLTGLGIAVCLSLVSAAFPAWRGMRLQVADALAGR